MSPANPRLRVLVLGSAAGGGVPQWNCSCRICRLAWSGDPRVKPRTQAGLALSVDGANWVLLNASIDLRQQILATPALQPNAFSNGTIKTPGAARTPTEDRMTTNITATTTQA